VPVAAERAIRALVPAAQLERLRRRVTVAPTAVFPPASGERVGTVRITVPGVSLGSSPLVVSSVPPPPAAGDGPWWLRTVDAVAGGITEALDGLVG
jgi:hypothetical protein